MAASNTAKRRPFKLSASVKPEKVAPATIKNERPSRPRKPRTAPAKPPVESEIDDELERDTNAQLAGGAPIAPSNPAPVQAVPAKIHHDDAPGDAFVRMINNSGAVRGVVINQIANRLCDGYKFIEGEPTAPRLYGDPDKCDLYGTAGWYPRPRQMPKPNTDPDAYRIWLEQMNADVLTPMGNRAELQWGWIHRVKGWVGVTADMGMP
jgi:hypothetical protein